MYDTFDVKFWAGTEESFGLYLLCLKKMIDAGHLEKEAGVIVNHGAQADMGGEGEPPRLFSKLGDVGIIKIAGPLNNSDSYRNEWYGMTGYPEIRDALVHAAKDPGVGAIVLDVASGGGSVAGVFDTAKLISTIDSKVKPVHTFSGGGIMSAAYLLGSSGRSITVDQMTEAGSIGVVAVHQEMSKMLKDVGITPTVLRSGKYKALGNPFEPLSEEARTEMQGQLDHMYGIFVQHVADRRGTTYANADSKMAQGRVFIGTQAKDVGLVDNIASFDALITKVQGGIDSSKDRSKYGANSTNQNNKGMTVAKTVLTEQDIAALAEGGSVSVEAGAPALETGGAPAAAAAAPAAEAAAPAAAAAAAPAAAPAAAAPAAAAAAEPTALQVVQSQLAEAQGKVTDLSIELRDTKKKAEAMEGSHASMRAIALASVTRLKIALGQTAGGEDVLSDAELLASHDSLRKTFESKFKAGGVAAVAPADSAEKGTAGVSTTRSARIAATRPTK